MKEELFRKKSLERVKSPENLDEYIRVSSPGLWLVIVAAVVLLGGIFVWGIFGKIDVAVKCQAEVRDKEVVCYVDVMDVDRISKNMVIEIGDVHGYVVSADDYDTERRIYKVHGKIDIEDGSYDAKIVIERIKPIAFIFD